MQKVVAVPVDTAGFTLQEAAKLLEDAINNRLNEIGPHNILALQVIPAKQSFLLPYEPGDGHHEYHATDTGFIAVIAVQTTIEL